MRQSILGFTLTFIPVFCPQEQPIHQVSREEFAPLRGKTYEEVIGVLGYPARISRRTGPEGERISCQWSSAHVDAQPRGTITILLVRDEGGKFRVVKVGIIAPVFHELLEKGEQ